MESDFLIWPEQTLLRSQSRSYKFILADEFSRVISPMSYQNLNLLIESGEVLKDDQSTTVSRTSQGLIIKRFNPRGKGHKVKRAFRISRAKRCWDMSYAFHKAGLNVARPIMMYERRAGPVRRNAYFVSQDLQMPELLSELPKMSPESQQDVVLAMRDAFKKMRQHKISHGDLKATNLLWRQGTLYFIDLDAAKQHKKEVTWTISHQKDVKRFLKNWINQPELYCLFKSFELEKFV